MPGCPRRRIEGEREQEILTAALTLVGEVGYDRLTVDAVAQRAQASKASLYRRWASKAELVAEAFSVLGCPKGDVPDTGSLAGDLLALAGQDDGLLDDGRLRLLTGLATALHRDPELAAAWRAKFLAPRASGVRSILERAQRRGEVGDDADLELITAIVPAMVIYHLTIAGLDTSPEDLVNRVIQRVVLPACRGSTPHRVPS